MAYTKRGNALVVTPKVDAGKWGKATKGNSKTASTVISQYDPSKWLLSHVTIMASVDLEEAKPGDPKSAYLIKPEHSIFVNNNGDCWERDLLAATYTTFLGANNYCFPAGTRVLMADGTYKAIDEIEVGEKVINKNGEVGTVKNTFKREASDLYEIKSKGIMSRSLYATGEHPLWVYSARKDCQITGGPLPFDKDKLFHKLGSWEGVLPGSRSSLNNGDPKNLPSGLSLNWKETKDIDSNRDFLTHPLSAEEKSVEDINLNRATLIGWFLAEGSYIKTNNSSEEDSGISFALGNEEHDIAEKLSALLIEEFWGLFSKNSAPQIIESQSGSLILTLSNKKVAEYFYKWCGKYSWAKQLHEDVMYLDKGLQAQILKSLLDGSGCGITKSKGYILDLKGQALIQQIQWLSWRLGLKPVYKEAGVLPRYTQLEIKDGYEVYTDPVTGKKSRPGYTLRWSLADSIKLDKLSMGFYSCMEDKETARKTVIASSEEGAWAISKIDSVEPINGTYDVYNIEVDNDNSYVVEGIAVHNCEHVQIPEYSKGKVVDIALREVDLGTDYKGDKNSTLYVDLLIATSWEFPDICNKILSGEYNATSMGCFLEGTSITMSDGTKKPIEKVLPGEKVITHTGKASLVKNTQIKRKDEEIFKISFEGGYKDIFVTKEHPFFAIKRDQECACGCGAPVYVNHLRKSNDFSYYPYAPGHHLKDNNPSKKDYDPDKKTRRVAEPDWVEAEDLRVGDFLTYPTTGDEIDTEVSIEQARLLGYFLADGSYVKKTGLEFSLGEHEYNTLNKEIADLAEGLFPEGKVFRYEDRVKIISPEAVAFIEKFSTEYSDGKKLSEEVMTWSVLLQKHLLATWFLGDSGCSVSKDLSDQFRLIAHRCGVRTNLHFNEGKDYTCTTDGKEYEGCKRGFYVHQINTLGSEILEPFYNHAFDYENRNTKKSKKTLYDYASYDKGFQLRKITKIEKQHHTGEVYNMEVEGDNSYIAEDVAVHNCLVQYGQCSRCGNVAKDESEQCEHVKYYLRNKFYDSQGKERIIAEICGHKDDPKSVTFIDASWVRNPAFPGAVLRNIVSPGESAEKVKSIKGVDPLMDSVDERKEISTEHHLTESFKKVAAEGDNDGAARFMDEPKEETPAEEPTEEGVDPSEEEFPAPEEGSPEGDAGEEQPIEETTQEEAQDTPLEDLQKEITDGILTQVKRQLLDQVKQTLEPKKGDIPQNVMGPNNSLIKEAASYRSAKYLKDKYSIDIAEVDNIKLAASLLALSSVTDITGIKKLGFTRRDAVEVLSFVDKRINGEGISSEVKTHLASSTKQGKELVVDFMVDHLKRPTKREAQTMKVWANLLKNFK